MKSERLLLPAEGQACISVTVGNNFTKVSFCHRAMSHRSRTKASVDRHGYSGRLNKTKDKLEDVDFIALRGHRFSQCHCDPTGGHIANKGGQMKEKDII